jgi:hypothetical protein
MQFASCSTWVTSGELSPSRPKLISSISHFLFECHLEQSETSAVACFPAGGRVPIHHALIAMNGVLRISKQHFSEFIRFGALSRLT